MVEVVSGSTATLNTALSGGLTYKGKKLEFKEVEGSNGQVYQATTNLTDEEIANGNNDAIITFSLEQAQGNVVVSRVPIEEKEREEIAKSVNDSKKKLKEGENYEAQPLGRADQLLQANKGSSTPDSKQAKTLREQEPKDEFGGGGSTAKVKTSDKDFKL